MTDFDDDAPTVFIVDDDEAVRESLNWLLRSIELPVRTFASAADFLEAQVVNQRGCLVTDVRMPGMSGLDLQRRLIEDGNDLPVIIITGHGDVQMAVRAMKAGAFDFVEKPFNDQALLDLVQRAVKHSVTAHKHREEQQYVLSLLERLTPRERQVLGMIVAGETNKGIAHHLDISDKTVEAHRARVMEKTESRSLAELLKKVMVLETYQ